MRKIVITLLLSALLMPATLLADSYTSLWKQYAAAQKKDLPQTQLKVLQDIISKSTAERAYGHLLKAQTKAAVIRASISPDSVDTEVARMERLEAEAARTDVVLAAVYESVLGTYYTENPQLSDSAKQMAQAYFDKSVSHPDALAKAYATSYEPFVTDGVDSRIFGDDMLHVIGFAAGKLSLMHDYYLKAGNRPAACLLALKMLRQTRDRSISKMRKSKYMQKVDSLLNEYKDLQVAGEVAIERYSVMKEAADAAPKEMMSFIDYALVHWGAWPRMSVLRNAQSRLTLPSFHVRIGDDSLTPDTPRKVTVMRLCNVNELTMTVTRVNIDGDTELNPNNPKDLARIKSHATKDEPYSQTRRYLGLPAYKEVRDTMEIPGLKTGMYLVEFSTDNTSMRHEACLLHVSDIYVMTQSVSKERIRFAAVSATTGMPVAGAHIRLSAKDVSYEGTKIKKLATLTTDDKGEAAYDVKNDDDNFVLYAYTDTDKAAEPFGFQHFFRHLHPVRDTHYINVFTDRKLYRPGQTVHLSAVAYKRSGSKYAAMPGSSMKICVTVFGKVIDSTTVVTDDYGTVATKFVLPADGPTGHVSISATNSETSGFASVRMEEYKRPTFSVSFDTLKAAYAVDDTVSMAATARTFSGFAVQGAKVRYTVIRRPRLLWWRGDYNEGNVEVAADSTTTDADGRFSVRVPLTMPEDKGGSEQMARFYSFDVTATVTDGSGESQRGSTSVPLGSKPTVLECDLPERIVRDSISTITFIYKNSAGNDIDGDVTFYIDDMRLKAKANVPCKIAPATLSSASHQLTAYCGNDTIKRSFVVFSLDDKRAATQTHDWFYVSADHFASESEPVYIQLGSSDAEQHVVYTAIVKDSVIESGSIDLKGELYTRRLTYKPEYGDAILLCYAWVKDGICYTHEATIKRPIEDTRLKTQWTTFRDRLKPGQKEEWTLHVSSPDGKAVKAQVMATMYDKSLDMISRYDWGLRLPLYLSLPYGSWNEQRLRDINCFGELPFKPLAERMLDFSHFVMDIPGIGPGLNEMAMPYIKSMGRPMKSAARGAMLRVTGTSKVFDYVAEDRMEATQMAKMNTAESEADDAGNGDTAAQANGTSTRADFSETAFFEPRIMSDGNGDVKIRFTVPESVTTWKVMGIAHDKNMRVGVFGGETVAQKDVMVQPNVPRFVRSTDKASVGVRLTNITKRDLKATLRIELSDPDNGRTVYTASQKLTLPADSAVSAAFVIDMPAVENDGLLVCRVTASGNGFSDGEQHYLPVIAAAQHTINTLPFTIMGRAARHFDVGYMLGDNAKDASLTVEYAENPSWLMVQTLPSVTSSCDDNAMSLATSLYVNMTGRMLMHSSPAIRSAVEQWQQSADKDIVSPLSTNSELKEILLSETPWLNNAANETRNMQQLASFYDSTAIGQRIDAYVQKLQKLQRFDGSFSWWKGMGSSMYATMSVAETLARLSTMTTVDRQVGVMVDKAVSYLASGIHKECERMRKREKRGDTNVRPSEMALNYLYLCTLNQDSRTFKISGQKDFDYLIDKLTHINGQLSIYGKARSAIILQRSGHKAQAATLVKSLHEYLVGKPDMGQYFDTRKAQYSWRDYRIPTQVAAIEAIRSVTPDDSLTVSNMLLWLLQSKRTQGWDTPLNTVDAVYAFLTGTAKATLTADAVMPDVRIDDVKAALPKSSAALGYTKMSRDATGVKSVDIDKQTDGTSWGAVYTVATQPLSDVKKSAAGMTVERQYFKDGHRITDLSGLRVGDRITVRIVVTADRDYDFVQIADHRAACMEPVIQTSGYSNGCYMAMKDNATYYYYSTMSKGKHHIETTYYIDRTGDYRTGLCTAQCAYSPAFAARDVSTVVTVR